MGVRSMQVPLLVRAPERRPVNHVHHIYRYDPQQWATCQAQK